MGTAPARSFAAAFLALGLVLRYDLPGFGLGRDAWFTVLAFWFFAAGWAAAKATATWQRVIVTLVLVVGLHGYFNNSGRETLVLAGFAPADLAARAALLRRGGDGAAEYSPRRRCTSTSPTTRSTRCSVTTG